MLSFPAAHPSLAPLMADARGIPIAHADVLDRMVAQGYYGRRQVATARDRLLQVLEMGWCSLILNEGLKPSEVRAWLRDADAEAVSLWWAQCLVEAEWHLARWAHQGVPIRPAALR